MLKQVVFMLKKENILSEIKPLLHELAAHGVAIDWRGGHECMETDWRSGNENSGEPAETTLYITDDAVWQRMLRTRDLPVLIYFHEENRQENFALSEYAIEKIEEVEYESLELAYLRLTGQPWTILETDRCVIRETTVEDIDCFYEIYKEPAITEYMEDLYADKDEEIAYIQDYIKNMYCFYGYGMWTVLEKAGGQIIGRAGISWREGYEIPELGFVIAVPYQRQGFAYEVCRAILAYGKEELGFTQFQAVIMEGNEKSMALCQKLGFTDEDELEMDGVNYKRMLFVEISGN